MAHPPAHHPEADRQTSHIVNEINDKGKNHSADFSGVAKEIYDMHRHNPGIFKDEMKRVNEAFHNYEKANGLPQVDIVGSSGSDIITRSADGKQTQHRDGANINRLNEQNNEASKTGPKAGEKPDGTSQYEVKKGDTPWSISQQRLKDAGQIDDKTDPKTANNLIANYVKESGLEHKKIHPGDKLDLPTVQKGGDGTEFGAEHKLDKLGDQAKQQSEQLAKQQKEDQEAAKAISYGLNAAGRYGLHANLTQQNVDQLLTHQDLKPEEKAGLQYIKENWGKLKDFQSASSQGDMISRNSFNAGGLKRLEAEHAGQKALDQTYQAMRTSGSDL